MQAFRLPLLPQRLFLTTNSPSPASRPSVNLPVAISPAWSRPAFASPTYLIKFGLLPSYPHTFTVAAPSPVPCLASALRTSPCTWHTPGLWWPSPSRAPRPALPSGSQRFPSFVSIPSMFPCPSGILCPFSVPQFSSFLWLPSPLAPPWCPWASFILSPALSHPQLLLPSDIFLLSSLLPRQRN